MREGLRVDGSGRHGLLVLYTAAAIACGIAVDDFIVLPRVWYAQPVAVARHRGEIAHKHERLVLFLALAHKGHNAIILAIHINPAEPCHAIIHQTQRLISPLNLAHAPSLPSQTSVLDTD